MTKQQLLALDLVRSAAAARKRADAAYQEALLDAHAVGCTFRAIGAAAGISGPSAYDYISRKIAGSR